VRTEKEHLPRWLEMILLAGIFGRGRIVDYRRVKHLPSRKKLRLKLLEIEAVVNRALVSATAMFVDKVPIPELSEVIGNEILGQLEFLNQVLHALV
jgi:hypothetical protein